MKNILFKKIRLNICCDGEFQSGNNMYFTVTVVSLNSFLLKADCTSMNILYTTDINIILTKVVTT